MKFVTENSRFWRLPALVVLSLVALVGQGVAQMLTVQVGVPSTPPAPTALVGHQDVWHYHKGTNAPVVGWQTLPDASLDASWLTGPGGFGYSSDTVAETNNCRTILTDMQQTAANPQPTNYSTLYLRRTFNVTGALDPSLRLSLVADYDDGFVAYLDGVEVLRLNAGGTGGVEPSVGARAAGSHESSLGTSGLQPSTNDLGTVGSLLAPGQHTLAIIGLNAQTNSTDFVMVFDLLASSSPTAQAVVSGPLLAIVRTNTSVAIGGTNTWPGTAKVLVNGVEANYTPIDGHWFATIPLAAGLNRPLIQAVDAGGIPLFTTNTIIISDVGSTAVGGTISANTTWSPAMGIIRMTNHVTVSGATLDILPGTVVLVGTGFNLRATNNSTLNISGTENQIVGLFPMDANSNWGEIAADGTNSFLTVRHAESIAAAVKGRNDSTCLLENSFFHDYKNGSVPIGGCTSARSMTVRRCHFRIYHETLWQNTLMIVEECLFELANNPSSDALDFDGAIVGSEIRRCTFRHGPQSNTDAIDIGPTTSGSGSTNTFIHDNLMFDFPNDKGVSIGEGSYGIIVSNCLIYGNDSGVAVKDSPGGKPPCTANIFNCTIVDCDYGYRVYNKSMPASPTNGGQITNSYNNIIWAPRIATFEILNAGIVTADHSDFSTNWPGTGNFEADPRFLNAAQRDYRLATNSPCIGTGRDGATLGTHFPVGSPMAPSHPVLSSIEHVGNNALVKFWVDSEKTYSLLCTTNVNGGPWVKIADAFPYPTARLFTVTNSTAGNTNRFYRLVSPRIP